MLTDNKPKEVEGLKDVIEGIKENDKDPKLFIAGFKTMASSTREWMKCEEITVNNQTVIVVSSEEAVAIVHLAEYEYVLDVIKSGNYIMKLPQYSDKLLMLQEYVTPACYCTAAFLLMRILVMFETIKQYGE